MTDIKLGLEGTQIAARSRLANLAWDLLRKNGSVRSAMKVFRKTVMAEIELRDILLEDYLSARMADMKGPEKQAGLEAIDAHLLPAPSSPSRPDAGGAAAGSGERNLCTTDAHESAVPSPQPSRDAGDLKYHMMPIIALSPRRDGIARAMKKLMPPPQCACYPVFPQSHDHL